MKRFFTLLITLIVCFSSMAAYSATLEQQQHETRAKINKLKWLENLETNKLYKNQQKLETTTNNLKTSKIEYSTKVKELDNTQYRLSQAMGEFVSLDYQMKERIRQIFKNQRYGFFMVLINSTDINTLIDRMYFESIIVKNDFRQMTLAKQKAKEIAMLRISIENQKRNLELSIKSINTQQRTIQKAIARNENMISKLRSDRSYYEKTERELARQSASLGTMINKTSTADSNIHVSAGFMKPIAGGITSPFGWRVHPIFKSRTFHSGVDIGGQYRGAIRASNAGKVIYSGWYGGYGKVVILDHGSVNGKPTTTLYAHMDSIAVSNGQYVTKGQTLGYEGTTGYSTGPHCHFEVRTNGQPNNPLNYI